MWKETSLLVRLIIIFLLIFWSNWPYIVFSLNYVYARNSLLQMFIKGGLKLFRVKLIVLIVSSFWSNDFLLRTNIWTTIKQQQSPISTLDCLFSKDGSTTWTPTFWRLLLPYSYNLFVLIPQNVNIRPLFFQEVKNICMAKIFLVSLLKNSFAMATVAIWSVTKINCAWCIFDSNRYTNNLCCVIDDWYNLSYHHLERQTKYPDLLFLVSKSRNC